MFSIDKYSIIGVVTRTIRLGGRIFDCWLPIVVYAALLTAISAVFSIIADIYQTDDIVIFNSRLNDRSMLILGIIYILICTHLLLAFTVDFYDQAFNRQVFKWRNLWQRDRSKWFSELFLFGYIMAYILPFGLALKLLSQQANPDWRIEFIYFTIIFAVFILILLLIRLSFGVSRYLTTHRLPPIKEMLKQTSGSAYVAVILFLVLIAIALLSSLRLGIWLDILPMISPWLKLPTLWLNKIIFLGFLGLMIVFTRAQDELLAPTEDSLKN